MELFSSLNAAHRSGFEHHDTIFVEDSWIHLVKKAQWTRNARGIMSAVAVARHAEHNCGCHLEEAQAAATETPATVTSP